MLLNSEDRPSGIFKEKDKSKTTTPRKDIKISSPKLETREEPKPPKKPNVRASFEDVLAGNQKSANQGDFENLSDHGMPEILDENQSTPRTVNQLTTTDRVPEATQVKPKDPEDHQESPRGPQDPDQEDEQDDEDNLSSDQETVNLSLINSRRASVNVRDQEYFDRITYYNNFKLCNEDYQDPDFPPNFSIITKRPYEQINKYIEHKITFLRVREIFKTNRKIYSSKKRKFFQVYPSYYNFASYNIVVHLINQNRVVLKKIFHKRILDDSGVYSVNLFLNNKWQSVQVDDYLPLINNKLFFTSSNSLEPWPGLLEKAIVKVVGSYEETSKLCNLDNLLRICTGCFSKRYYFRRDMREKDLRDYLCFWKGMIELDHTMLIKTNHNMCPTNPELQMNTL